MHRPYVLLYTSKQHRKRNSEPNDMCIFISKLINSMLTNLFSWIMEAFCEFHVVNFSIIICVNTHHEIVNFFPIEHIIYPFQSVLNIFKLDTYTLYIFCISMARWNSFGEIQPSWFVSKSWKAWEEVISFSFRNMSKNFSIISTLCWDSARASTICFPIGPFRTLPARLNFTIN